MRFSTGMTPDEGVEADDIFEIVQGHMPDSHRLLQGMLDEDPTLAEDTPSQVWAPTYDLLPEIGPPGSAETLGLVGANVATRIEQAVSSIVCGDMSDVGELTVVCRHSRARGIQFHTITTHRRSERPYPAALNGGCDPDDVFGPPL